MPIPNRTWPALLPGPERYPGFDVEYPPFDPSSTVHFRSPSWTLSDAVLPRLLTGCSPRWLLTTAAPADLQPAPVDRLREACSHLRHSFPLHTTPCAALDRRPNCHA